MREHLNQRGSILVMTAVVMTAIIGMAALVIDVGSVILEKHELRNAVDAAALAGGQELPADPDAAVEAAMDYALMNGSLLEKTAVEVDEDCRGIRVSAEQTVSYKFAKIFGHTTKDVSQSAYVKLGAASSVYSGIRPFAVEWGDFQYGQSVTLKQGGGDGETGNYGAVALGFRGADSFSDNVKFGYDGKISVGDIIDTEPGNMSGPTVDSVNYILGNDDSTFDNFPKDSIRLWTIPVVDSFDVLGRGQIQVTGFAIFFVEDTQTVDGDAVVTGRFLEIATNADIDVTQTYYGANGLKLME